MFKRTRILSLGLAMALCMAQTAQAEILITPLDVSNPAGQGVQIVPESQGGAGTQAQNQPGPQEKPGAGQSPQAGNQSAQSGPTGPQAGDPNTQSGPTGSQTGTVTAPASGILEYRTHAPVNGTAGAVQDMELSMPAVSAEAAILFDATHNTVLFEKNADEKLYPASITKLMTALLVLEKADLNDTVVFSKTAVTNLESGAVTLKIQEGDRVSVRDCLYGLLLKSANEVANGLAEHVGGSIQGFADLMNRKAAELGCTGTHFTNPSGLNDPDHYTTARDMAKIAGAAFKNEMLQKISSSLSYEFPATKAAAARTITPGHKMLYPSDSRYYEGMVGGKTGYTSLAGNTLVTCTEKDGVRLIAVVLKARSTHYGDTKAMLDYGYKKIQAFGSGPYHQWVQNGDGWYFRTADGQLLKGCRAVIDGAEYGFDDAGKMRKGWQKYGEDWYYFRSDGSMVKNDWRQDGDKWFYLGSGGAMVRNAWVDQTYYVGADGVWVQQ